jgi:ubiquinone/menaquinone biosynthesis C-methylase UbiE
MTFPGLEEIVALASSDYEREFLRGEFAPGLEYYVGRIDRLLLAGDRVLDAGCGAGQWSMALAQRFRRVDAVDRKPERLAALNAVAERMGVQNVESCSGSLEELPYSDAAFDAVFCYGVIMFTRVDEVLREFHRVLRPGGRVYLCLNADGWSRYLAERPSDNNSPLPQRYLNAGLTTLYTTYWQRAVEQQLRDALVEGAKDYPEGLLPWEERFLFKAQRRITRIARRWMATLGGIEWRRSVARDCLCRSSVGRELLRRVRGFCGEQFVPLLLDDISALLEFPTIPSRFGPTRALRPEEVAALAAHAGFADFQWSVEAGLTCDWLKPASPKYPGYYGNDLCVWECLLTRPRRACAIVSLERHFEAARQAALAPAYGEPAPDPVLSNASAPTFPAPLVAYARWQGEMLGGQTYMRQLARTIVDGESEEEQAVRRIIRFVQKAVFRDPVVQPLGEDGSLPDGLTALVCARGRCGHTARILVELFQHAGFEARLRQFPRHVVAEAKCGDRWVVADADAFKGGIVPETPEGRLLSMDQIEAAPHLLDRFPPTGWMMRPKSKYTKGLLGYQVRGYVDALEPDRRGFVSGYYVPSASGFPPSLPEIRHFEAHAARFVLSWEPARLREGRLAGYRVRVGTASRDWTYDDVFLAEAPLRATSCDVLETETSQTRIEGAIPPGSARLFASVTAVSDRIEREPATFFWPSEEAVLVPGHSTTGITGQSR